MTNRKGYLKRKSYKKARWKKAFSRYNLIMERYYPGWLEEHEIIKVGRKKVRYLQNG